MIVFDLAVEEFSEAACFEKVPSVDAGLPIITRLRHHVTKARLFFDLLEFFGFSKRQTGGYRGNDVKAPAHAHLNMPSVVGRSRKHGHGVEVLGPLQHHLERVVEVVTAILLAEPLATVGSQVRNGGNLAVGMLVPKKGSSESASDDTKPDLLSRTGRRRHARLHCHRRAESCRTQH